MLKIQTDLNNTHGSKCYKFNYAADQDRKPNGSVAHLKMFYNFITESKGHIHFIKHNRSSFLCHKIAFATKKNVFDRKSNWNSVSFLGSTRKFGVGGV